MPRSRAARHSPDPNVTAVAALIGEASRAAIAKPARIVALRQHIIASELHVARSCYDHVAGRLGVGITEALVARRTIVLDGPSNYRVTRSGEAFFAAFGVDLVRARAQKRHFARSCPRDLTT